MASDLSVSFPISVSIGGVVTASTVLSGASAVTSGLVLFSKACGSTDATRSIGSVGAGASTGKLTFGIMIIAAIRAAAHEPIIIEDLGLKLKRELMFFIRPLQIGVGTSS